MALRSAAASERISATSLVTSKTVSISSARTCSNSSRYSARVNTGVCGTSLSSAATVQSRISSSIEPCGFCVNTIFSLFDRWSLTYLSGEGTCSCRRRIIPRRCECTCSASVGKMRIPTLVFSSTSAGYPLTAWVAIMRCTLRGISSPGKSVRPVVSRIES